MSFPSSPPSPPTVPYQAYKSKRHSRNVSNPNQVGPVAVLPTSTGKPSFNGKSGANGPEHSRSSSSNDHLHSEGQFSLNGVPASHYGESFPRNVAPLPATTQLISQNSWTKKTSSGSSPPSSRTSTPSQTPTTISPSPSKTTLYDQAPFISVSPGIASVPSTSTSLPASVAEARKKVTFRRVPLRNALVSDTSSSPIRNSARPHFFEEPGLVVLPPASSPRRSNKVLSDTTASMIKMSSSERELPQLQVLDMQIRADLTPAPAISAPLLAITPTVSSSTQSSTVRTQTPSPSRISAPYRHGFQPKGVYRPLTDEFLALRRQKLDNKTSDGGGLNRVERTKLERRLEKLIMLHFLHDEEPQNRKPTMSNGRRSSSFFDLENFRNITVGDAVDKWKNALANGITDSTKLDIRAASEQRITPWQNDADVSKCPICSTSFHPLTNRKHHCRLCGKIVCSLPPKRPQRHVPCSLLFIVDSKTREIEEVGEGVDYGVKKRINEGQQKSEDEDKFLRGVRICRDCRPVLRRQQYQQEILRVPHFMKLYETFLSQEKNIEEALPQFQELILSLSHDQPTKEAYTARKRILEAFAQYDALSKEIRRIPCPNGPGSSQDRIQLAILTRANIFLQKNMFPLQSLPGKDTGTKVGASDPCETSSPEQAILDPDSDLARKIQPLLEQEALLESFIDEAKARRKFEDVKTLKANLREVRSEIEKLLR
ncbi:FYVE zinc finger-domain-containing protein [Cyathus striatus]|nr:FYVE zinc finger-domain-containing protein [Cyathus striatus]